MSESARATMNQWVAFIRFLRTHRTITTIRLATIDTMTENHYHNFYYSFNAKMKSEFQPTKPFFQETLNVKKVPC